MWKASVLTLFPEAFPGPLGISVIGRALEEGKWSLDVHNIREFAPQPHRHVDDTPYGGGPGMVMRADILGKCIDNTLKNDTKKRPLIYLSPKGKPLSQCKAKQLSKGDGVILLCGRYEGIDQRIIDHYQIEEMSVGDYILSGGEIAALSVLDACVRLIPDVIGDVESLKEESFEEGLLEYPHYTRPEEWNGHKVPEVLKSGHHENIVSWRKSMMERETQRKRQDLWISYCQESHDRKKKINKPISKAG